VLLDEIEKAHPDAFNILLQVLDDGRLTDNKGVTVDFTNTIIIMTSNIGSHLISEEIEKSGGEMDEDTYRDLQAQLLEQLRKTIRPEFLNRIDDVVVFHPLDQSHIRQIVDIQLRRVEKMLGRNKVSLSIPEKAKDWLAARGYDPVYGARPLKRLIQTEIVNQLAKQLIKREDDTQKIEYEATVSKDGNRLEFVEVYSDAEAWAD
jgi:ATP-dependent Clp protease ATP-binding subunit ClpB